VEEDTLQRLRRRLTAVTALAAARAGVGVGAGAGVGGGAAVGTEGDGVVRPLGGTSRQTRRGFLRLHLHLDHPAVGVRFQRR